MTEIIAEVGECFNGDMETAHRMIQTAKDCGCDVVKFQILDMAEVAADDPEYDWFAKIALDRDRIHTLITWAQEAGIRILFTPVSLRTAAWLVEEGQTVVKIASSFVKKQELLAYINAHFATVYASTGMAGLDDVNRLVAALDKVKHIKLLHCVSEYPTGPLLDERGLRALDERDAHLQMMAMLKALYPGIPVGYSDHTDDIFVPTVAAAMGAELIEKHFTLDRATPIRHYEQGLEYMGTDHVLSVEPSKLKEMVQQIRRVEAVRGPWRWERSAGERILIDFLQGRYQKR